MLGINKNIPESQNGAVLDLKSFYQILDRAWMVKSLLNCHNCLDESFYKKLQKLEHDWFQNDSHIHQYYISSLMMMTMMMMTSVGGKTARRDDNGQRKRFGRRLVFSTEKGKSFLLAFLLTTIVRMVLNMLYVIYSLSMIFRNSFWTYDGHLWYKMVLSPGWWWLW